MKDIFTPAEDLKLPAYSKKKMEGELTFEGNYQESLTPFISPENLKFFFLLLGFIFILLFIKTFYLQILKGNHYRKIAEGNRIRIEKIEAPRGVIYDRNNKVLVKNIASFSLSFVPGDLPKEEKEREKIILKLSKILDENEKVFREIINNSSPYSYYSISIKENLDYKKALLLEIETEKLPGVILETVQKREYLEPSLAHLLGYMGKITKEEWEKNKEKYELNTYLGRSGIEYQEENLLKGENGRKRIEVDSLGKEEKVIGIEKVKKGDDLVLTIDLELQKIASKALKNQLEKNSLKKGSLVILNVKNGEILALVSYPLFDNNKLSQGISYKEYEKLINNPYQPLFFRSISGEYPSGSIIKMIIASAALEENIINEKTLINSTGGLKVGDWFFPDWRSNGHGLTNVTKALAESVNTFFYTIVGGYSQFKGLGIEKLISYFKMFDLGEKTGIGLINEKKGFIPSPEWKLKVKNEPWYIGDLYNLSIGQGDILVTPLQVALFTSAIANDGIVYKTHLIKEIIDSKGDITKIKSEIMRQIDIKKDNFKIVKRGLREAVLYGSAKNLNDLKVEVAGKTGTAEVKGKLPHAWFTSFAPYEDPEIVITVLVENAGEGSKFALPVAKEILKWYQENRISNL